MRLVFRWLCGSPRRHPAGRDRRVSGLLPRLPVAARLRQGSRGRRRFRARSRSCATTPACPTSSRDADRDVFFGLGYAHAQDRLWQMMLHAAHGAGAPVRALRAADGRDRQACCGGSTSTRSPRASVDDQDPETLDALEAYSAGVNARIEEINSRLPRPRRAGVLPLRRAALPPWQPADCLAIIKLMALQLSGHLSEEVLRARTSLRCRTRPASPTSCRTCPARASRRLPEYAASLSGATCRSAPRRRPIATDMLDMPVAPRGLAGASNAWAAAPRARPRAGTLLANDPHLGFTAPSIWYLARMQLSFRRRDRRHHPRHSGDHGRAVGDGSAGRSPRPISTIRTSTSKS